MKKSLLATAAALTIISACGSSDQKVRTPVLPSQKAAMAKSATGTIKDSSMTAAYTRTGTTAHPLKPLTQFILVRTDESGTTFRSPDDMNNRLRTIGFDTSEYPATRTGANGTTTSVSMYDDGEDITMEIKFADSAERDDFLNSLKKAGWRKNGHVWAHRANVAGMGMVYAKIKGNTATLIQPSEMLPMDF